MSSREPLSEKGRGADVGLHNSNRVAPSPNLVERRTTVCTMPEGTPTPWSYALIRLLFRFVLKIFYGTIVVENAQLIPPTGQPCIVCANHSNSLTDALMLVTAIPAKRRNMLRLTAKSTQFGKRTFSSWLIESAGTIPIKRRKDFGDGEADNSDAMAKLMVALENGDAVCLFPEGMSRYHPTIAPLKTGVARLVSDVLSRNRADPNFQISVVTCSITYMHRQHFRSDVLVTFHPPITFTPATHPELLAPVDYTHIRAITKVLQEKISAGTIDSPSWNLVRSAKLAARIYAPLGTRMTLGDHVRVLRSFLEAFKTLEAGASDNARDGSEESNQLFALCEDLKTYQDQLSRWGIKDDRIRQPLPRHTIVIRMFIRFFWSLSLFTLSLPGLLLWLPVFITTRYKVNHLKKTGPIFDTWDEIAQIKLIYGLMSGFVVWITTASLSFRITPFSVIYVPALMWISLRWYEDAVSASRALAALYRLLRVGKPTLKVMHERRQSIRDRLLILATTTLGLPQDPETYFTEVGGREKGRVRGEWDSSARYFSIRRRRKQDWNETLRLYDQVDYPEDE